MDGLNISALYALLSNYYNQLPLQAVGPPSVQYIFPPMNMNLFHLPVAPLNAPTWLPINHQNYFIQPIPIANNEPMCNLQREPIIEDQPVHSDPFIAEFNRIYYNNRN